MFEHFLLGLTSIASPSVQLMTLLGVLAGIFVSCLPGLSATMAVALLLPLTFGLSPVGALLLLSGIYVGAMFGGAIPAILLSTPGTPSAVSTTFDGYPMAQKGHAGKAISVACIASVAAGLFGVFVLMPVAPPLAEFALRFSAPEYFAVAVFGLAAISSLSEGSVLKAFASGMLGLLLAVMAPARLKGFPNVPTAKEKGFDLDISTWRALVVPGKTPDAPVKVLHDAFKKSLESPGFVEFMEKGGFGLGYLNAEELGRFMAQQTAMFKPLLEEAGLAKK